MKDNAPLPAPGKALTRRIALLREAIAPARLLRIADVGANPVNVPAYMDMLLLQACEVWGFEPDVDAFAALEKTALPGTHYVQRALGPTGPGTFYPHQATGMGSLFKVDEASANYLGRSGWFGRQKKGIPVDLISLDDLPEADLPAPDVLKMDIQGGELAVLQTGRKRLADAVAIIPEVRFAQIYADEPLWGDVDAELRGQGFVLHKLAEAKSIPLGNAHKAQMRHEKFRNQLLDGDAVYIRDPRGIADWPENQIKQLVMASAGVFDSLDLTLHLLDELEARGTVAADTSARFYASLPKWMRK